MTKVNSRFLHGERKGDGIWKSYGNESQDVESVNYLDGSHGQRGRLGGRALETHITPLAATAAPKLDTGEASKRIAQLRSCSL